MTIQRIPPHWPRRAAELVGLAAPAERPSLLVLYRIKTFERAIAREQALDAQLRERNNHTTKGCTR